MWESSYPQYPDHSPLSVNAPSPATSHLPYQQTAMELFLFLLALAGVLTHVGASPECSNSRLLIDHDYASSTRHYFHSCTHEDSVGLFAVCIAQRNSLAKLLDCSNIPRGAVWTADIIQGSALDRDDLLDDDDKSRTSDGRIRFTPKEILQIIARSPQCDHAQLSIDIGVCPYTSLSSFLDCLCCEGVTPDEMDQIQKCIHRFIEPDGWVPQDLLDSEPKIRDYCGVYCVRPTLGISSGTDDDQVLRCASNHRWLDGRRSCVELVKDGRPQPPHALNVRQANDDDDFGDYRIWDLKTLEAVPTRSLGTIRPTSLNANHAATIADSDGQTTSVASHEVIAEPTARAGTTGS